MIVAKPHIIIYGDAWREYFNKPSMTEKELLEKAIGDLPRKYR